MVEKMHRYAIPFLSGHSEDFSLKEWCHFNISNYTKLLTLLALRRENDFVYGLNERRPRRPNTRRDNFDWRGGCDLWRTRLAWRNVYACLLWRRTDYGLARLRDVLFKNCVRFDFAASDYGRTFNAARLYNSGRRRTFIIRNEEGVTFEQAIELLMAHVTAIDETEEVSLIEAVGRVAAENYFATFDNPPFDRSPLDGYALNSSDTPNKFKVIGEECAGDFFADEVHHGEALRIMTGAAIPKGCDCVIRQEDVTLDGENIFVTQKLKHHENYCFAGEDIKSGALLVEKNSVLTAAHVAILASQGVTRIKVYRRPRIAVTSTGDELIATDEKLSVGKIYNSNLYLLAARLIELGFEPKILGNLPDDADICAKKISALNVDLLITTGGVSVGKKDIMHEVVAKIGRRIFLRVQIKPGAPVIGWTCGNFLGLSLSGNPFVAYATFELLARPVLAKLSP